MNFNLIKQTKSILIFVLAVALLGGVSYGGYRYWQTREQIPEPQEPIVEEKEIEWKTYTSSRDGYTLKYPPNLEVSVAEFPDQIIRFSPYENAAAKCLVSFLPPGGYASNNDKFYVRTWDNEYRTWYELKTLKEWGERFEGFHHTPTLSARVAGEDAFIYTGHGKPESSWVVIMVLFSKEGKIFRISYETYWDKEADLDLFFHILKTFEFNGEVTEDELPEITREDLKTGF